MQAGATQWGWGLDLADGGAVLSALALSSAAGGAGLGANEPEFAMVDHFAAFADDLLLEAGGALAPPPLGLSAMRARRRAGDGAKRKPVTAHLRPVAVAPPPAVSPPHASTHSPSTGSSTIVRSVGLRAPPSTAVDRTRRRLIDDDDDVEDEVEEEVEGAGGDGVEEEEEEDDDGMELDDDAGDARRQRRAGDVSTTSSSSSSSMMSDIR
jgi:hypothetical protein